MSATTQASGNCETLLEPSGNESYAIIPPLESFCEIKDRYLEKEFFHCVRVGDIVCGEVRTARSTGFPVDILCTSYGPVRDLTRCRIKGFLPFKAMPPLTSKALEKGDHIRGVVIGKDERHEELALSLMSSSLPKHVESVNLGIIDKDELPCYYRSLLRYNAGGAKACYAELLESSASFSNPSCVATLVQLLGIDDVNCKSELPSLRKLKIPEEEFALNLRQKQSRQHALQCVEMGIRYAKRGEVAAAVRQFNRALDLDHYNVEALVARGALYANREDFKKAIENFEKVLSINPKHEEARNYLYESLVGLALSHSRERCYESARRCLQKAGDIIPERRSDLEKIATRVVSPSLIAASSSSSPKREDCPDKREQTPTKSKSEGASSNRKKDSEYRISVSSNDSCSDDSKHRKKKHKKKHKKRHHSKSKHGSDDEDLKITGFSSSKSPENRSRPPPGSSATSVKRFNNGDGSNDRLDRKRLRHSLSCIDSFQPRGGVNRESLGKGGSKLSGDDSLEDMEKFLQGLKQKKVAENK